MSTSWRGRGVAFARHLGRDVGQGRAHQLGRVFAVEDRKPRTVAEEFGVSAQDPVACGVKGAAGHPHRSVFHQLFDPAQHLPRGLVGEGEEENSARRDAVLDQPAGSIDQGPGLAGAGAGEGEHRPAGVHDDRQLLLVEFLLVAHAISTCGVRTAQIAAHGREAGPKTERSSARDTPFAVEQQCGFEVGVAVEERFDRRCERSGHPERQRSRGACGDREIEGPAEPGKRRVRGAPGDRSDLVRYRRRRRRRSAVPCWTKAALRRRSLSQWTWSTSRVILRVTRSMRSRSAWPRRL